MTKFRLNKQPAQRGVPGQHRPGTTKEFHALAHVQLLNCLVIVCLHDGVYGVQFMCVWSQAHVHATLFGKGAME